MKNNIKISSPENYTKQCISAGITCTSDGLLRDFIARDNYHGALLVLNEALEKRHKEIIFLEELKVNLTNEITKTIKDDNNGN